MFLKYNILTYFSYLLPGIFILSISCRVGRTGKVSNFQPFFEKKNICNSDV